MNMNWFKIECFQKNNLNTQTDSNLDDIENESILPEDSNRTYTATANKQSINANKDTDIQRSVQNSNTRLINEYEMVQDSELSKTVINTSNPDPTNDGTNTPWFI